MILKRFYLNCLAHASLPTDRLVLVYCAGGYRSSIAASLLQRHGFTQVSEIAGGIAAWDAGKLPLET
jgi:hydroxyacylglutathione hydrolase